MARWEPPERKKGKPKARPSRPRTQGVADGRRAWYSWNHGIFATSAHHLHNILHGTISSLLESV